MEPVKVIYYRKLLLSAIEFNQVSVSVLNLLIEDIEIITGERLGFNTMRRFFGLMPTKAPSTKTWRTLRNYLSLKGVFSMNQSNKTPPRWENIHRTTHLLSSKKTDLLLAHLHAIKNESHFSYALGYITIQLIGALDTERLTIIYTDDQLFENKEEFADYLAEMVGSLLRISPLSSLDHLSNVLCLPHFRNSVLYFFIDYTHLNGYYGSLLSKIIASEYAEQVFLHCMLGYRDFLNNTHTTPINEISLERLKSFFPTLAGRYIGYRIITEPEFRDHDLFETIRLLSAYKFPHYLLVEVVPAIILTRRFETLDLFVSAMYEPMLEQDHWFASIPTALFLIAESILYFKEGDLRRSRIVHQSIIIETIPSSYYDYVRLFYMIPAYHLAEDPTQQELALQSYLDLSTKLGFTRFNRRMLVDYFTGV
jgi:hypothetical protein